MKNQRVKFGFLFFLFLLQIAFSAEWDYRAFDTKLIFSETPQIGKKWHGGLRVNDVFILDAYWNAGGLAAIDILRAGVKNLPLDDGKGKLQDFFTTVSVKSLPFGTEIKGLPYWVAGGFKVFQNNSRFESEDEDIEISEDKSTILFATQGLLFKEDHYFNLFTSVSFRENASATTYIVPGYRKSISEGWSVGLEYYLTNTLELPIKILQFAFDVDELDFYNIEKEWYSFMIFGFQYRGQHFRADLNLAAHISFSHLVLPILGIGWDF